MKAAMVLVLILLLIVIALPMAMGMGMGEMAECPMCTSAETHLVLGICAAVVTLTGLALVMGSRRIRSLEQSSRALLLSRPIYRPPQPA